MVNHTILEYLSTIQASVMETDTEKIRQIVRILQTAFIRNQTVYTMGNGASAALAAHMACDFGKGSATDLGHGPAVSAEPRLRVLSLTDNPALVTAMSNDIAYEDVFMEQLKSLLQPNDVVIGISGSGGSPNVLRAMEYAFRQGATTVGLTGEQPSAAKLAAFCQVCLQAPATMIEQIEDLHVIYNHVIGIGLRQVLAETRAATSERGRQNGRLTPAPVRVVSTGHDSG